ncbi:hypothetical protein [Bdellovibrio bacteriovorus]|uniref:Uncharacterized protein n=1 Tax=Bdellovibrio bacteriovorus str. Tiberius TaxID=1069642 RepID=K7Z845_BDEBC|nr:hypothetical protein [Bdellovibrio bacteriovorus]AFY00569.1 Hypothetical protein Bdt_0868 [Bdellovibrio bacteriovorus str. Tiberius]
MKLLIAGLIASTPILSWAQEDTCKALKPKTTVFFDESSNFGPDFMDYCYDELSDTPAHMKACYMEAEVWQKWAECKVESQQ